MLNVIQKVDPDFNYQQYDARQKTLNDMTPGGKLGQNILSFNTAMDHLGRAVSASDQMAQPANNLNTGSKPGNWLWQQYYAKSGGSPQGALLAQYNTDKQALVNELERAVGGQAPKESGKQDWSELLDSSVPYRNQKAALGEAANLMGDRLSEVAEAYKSSFGKLDRSLLSPAAEATLNAVGATDLVKKYGSDNGTKPYLNPTNQSLQSFPGSAPTPNQTGQLQRQFSASTGQWRVQNSDGTWRISTDGK
jgi:hypothetical protein